MLDFRPDLDPRTPGYLTLISELPTVKGYSPQHGINYGPPYTYTLIAIWCGRTRLWQPLTAAGGIVIVRPTRN